jgi:hypothetical protein
MGKMSLVVNDTARHVKTVSDLMPELSEGLTDIRQMQRNVDYLVQTVIIARPLITLNNRIDTIQLRQGTTLKAVTRTPTLLLTLPEANVKSHFLLPKRLVRGFIGREDIIKKIDQGFGSGDETDRRVVVLRAIGGQGKTQVALKYCKRVRDNDRFKVIFWTDATSANSLKKSFDGIADAIRTPTEALRRDPGVDFVLGKLEEWPEPWLLVFDNFDNPMSYNLQDYIPDVEKGCILITTRNAGADNYAQPLGNAFELPPLSNGDALKLLLNQSGKAETIDNLDQGREIVERLACYALAITQAVRAIHFAL